MYLARILIAGVLSAGTTFGLLFLMYSLISADIKEPDESSKLKLPDITMGERNIQEYQAEAKPEKPETPDEPPPDTPQPEVDTPEVDNAVNVSAPKMSGGLNIGLGAAFSDGDYMPIYAAPPMYPSRAMSRGIEGWVVVSFTVTPQGTVIDPVVVEGNPAGTFDSAALRAVKKFKYKPRVVDGTPIAVPGVSYKFTFKLQGKK